MKIGRIDNMDKAIQWDLVANKVVNGLPNINTLQVDVDCLSKLVGESDAHSRGCAKDYLQQIKKAKLDYAVAKNCFAEHVRAITKFLEKTGVHLTGGRAGVCIFVPEAFYSWAGVTPSRAYYTALSSQEKAKAVKRMPGKGTVIVVEPSNGLNNQVFCTVQVYTNLFGFTLSFKNGVLGSWNFFSNLPCEGETSQCGICVYSDKIRIWVNSINRNKHTGMFTINITDEVFERPYRIDGRFSITNLTSFASIHATNQNASLGWTLRSTDSY